MTAQAYPLQWPLGWPRSKKRVRSSFTITPDKARKSLFYEMKSAGASNIVISSNVQLRQDGQPYADELRRQHADPGVAVYFTLNGREMAMARDVYLQPHENIRSLSLTFAAMRAIERHGGKHMMDQAFTGFSALPPPNAKKAWWDVMGLDRNSTRDQIETRYRELAKRRHPDAGGSQEAMAELNQARQEALTP